MQARQELRQHMRAQRRALTLAQRADAAHALAQHLTTTPWFRNAKRIAAYLPVDGEIDPTPLIERAWSVGKEVYLPVLTTLGEPRLWFAIYRPDTHLLGNRFGIPEPAQMQARRVTAIGLDLVLAPLVAFDTAGNRLGMGGGYYDRSFAFLHQRRRWHKPRLLGLAYEFQKLARLQAASWDVPLLGVATERRLYHCAHAPGR